MELFSLLFIFFIIADLISIKKRYQFGRKKEYNSYFTCGTHVFCFFFVNFDLYHLQVENEVLF